MGASQLQSDRFYRGGCSYTELLRRAIACILWELPICKLSLRDLTQLLRRAIACILWELPICKLSLRDLTQLLRRAIACILWELPICKLSLRDLTQLLRRAIACILWELPICKLSLRGLTQLPEGRSLASWLSTTGGITTFRLYLLGVKMQLMIGNYSTGARAGATF